MLSGFPMLPFQKRRCGADTENTFAQVAAEIPLLPRQCPSRYAANEFIVDILYISDVNH